MHIAFVIQDLYKLGAQYVTAVLARGLAEKGHRVDVVVSAVHHKIARERRDLKAFQLPESVRLIGLPHLRSSRNVLALRQYFKTQRPDVVLPMSSNYEPSCVLACALMRKKYRPKLVPVEHSGGIGLALDQSKVHANRNKWGEDFAVSMMPKIKVDRCIAVSHGVAAAMVEVGRYKENEVSVIYNPVIDDVFWENRSRHSTHPWLNNKSMPIIVAAGAHSPLKGYDILIKALSLILPRKKCRLIIFGEGSETDKLQSLAESLGIGDSVSLPGHVDALPAELNQADLFVVSSHCESFSVVLVEALACGVPVVATNCPVGPAEVLKGGQYGTLVVPNDPKKLAEGIFAAISGAAIKPPVESWKPYVIENVVTQYEAVLQQSLT